MRIEPIKPLIGARIHVDRQALENPEVVERCLQALEDHGVLVFPQLGLADSEQLAFTNRLGQLGAASRKFPGGSALEGEVFEIAFDPNDPIRSDYVKVSFFWHIDGLVADTPIPKAALLTARRVAQSGGQTEFANCYAAYEALDDADKAQIENLEALHTPAAGFRFVLDHPSKEYLQRWATHAVERRHPLVWTHEDGRRSLMLGITADRIVGMPAPEGRALIMRLFEWVSQPKFKYRHEWQPGDLVIWNNHGVMHRVLPYDASSGRSMHRTSIDCVARVNQ
jgi:alpha-ketoglutarate-dependent taurine dioxygenase